MSGDSPYRLDELGWVLFERLCDAVLGQVLGIERGAWLGRADTCDRVAVVDDLEIDGEAVPSPCLIIVAWCPTMPSVSDHGVTGWVCETLAPAVWREAAAREGRVASVLVVSDVELPVDVWDVAAAERVITELGVPVRAVGPRLLGSILDADAALRRRLPFALGARELDPGLGVGSVFDLGAAAGLARVFVPTRAYARAVEVVERHRFAVLTGPPEMGKTAIARMLALACLSDGWQVVECAVPGDLWRAYDRDRRQVFVVDDAFGSTEYRPDAADRWALELDRVLRAMDESHWLLWTSRPAPFQAGLRRIHREHGVERFPRPAEVSVDASELTVEEKALMLLRHARRNSGAPGTSSLVRANGWAIVSHPHFTPERIRRFAGTHLPAFVRRGIKPGEIRRAIEREIREPTDGMRASFSALDPEQAAILVALLDVPPGPTSLRTLAAALRRHSTSRSEGRLELSVAGLLDHFVRQSDDGSVSWVHPSWRDLVIDAVAGPAESRSRFLRVAELDGLLLAISTAGGVGDRVFPFLVDDADWDELTGRLAALASTCTGPELHRILLAVAESITNAPHDREVAETEALTQTLLQRVRNRWNDQVSVPLPQLELWFRLNAAIPIPLDPPTLDRAWFELLPTRTLDLTDPSDLQTLDDWLTLAAILRRYREALLERYGFPGVHTPVINSLLTQARWLASGGALDDLARERLANVVRRAGTLGLMPVETTVAALQAADRLEQTDEQWFELRLDPGKPSRPSTAHDRELVDRILAEL